MPPTSANIASSWQALNVPYRLHRDGISATIWRRSAGKSPDGNTAARVAARMRTRAVPNHFFGRKLPRGYFVVKPGGPRLFLLCLRNIDELTAVAAMRGNYPSESDNPHPPLGAHFSERPGNRIAEMMEWMSRNSYEGDGWEYWCQPVGVLDEHGNVVCGAKFSRNGRVPSVCDLSLWIAPDFRGRGIGRLIVAGLVRLAQDFGFETIQASVLISEDEEEVKKAIESRDWLYNGLGFSGPGIGGEATIEGPFVHLIWGIRKPIFPRFQAATASYIFARLETPELVIPTHSSKSVQKLFLLLGQTDVDRIRSAVLARASGRHVVSNQLSASALRVPVGDWRAGRPSYGGTKQVLTVRLTEHEAHKLLEKFIHKSQPILERQFVCFAAGCDQHIYLTEISDPIAVAQAGLWLLKEADPQSLEGLDTKAQTELSVEWITKNPHRRGRAEPWTKPFHIRNSQLATIGVGKLIAIPGRSPRCRLTVFMRADSRDKSTAQLVVAAAQKLAEELGVSNLVARVPASGEIDPPFSYPGFHRPKRDFDSQLAPFAGLSFTHVTAALPVDWQTSLGHEPQLPMESVRVITDALVSAAVLEPHRDTRAGTSLNLQTQ